MSSCSRLVGTPPAPVGEVRGSVGRQATHVRHALPHRCSQRAPLLPPLPPNPSPSPLCSCSAPCLQPDWLSIWATLQWWAPLLCGRGPAAQQAARRASTSRKLQIRRWPTAWPATPRARACCQAPGPPEAATSPAGVPCGGTAGGRAARGALCSGRHAWDCVAGLHPPWPSAHRLAPPPPPAHPITQVRHGSLLRR